MIYKTIAKTTYKVSDFISFQRNGSLILSPSFQRRSVWSQPAKSFLIDTVVRGFPIPIIFLREQTNLQTLVPQREVVDGQQRLRTLIAYIAPDLLPDFDKNRDLVKVKKTHYREIAGKSFRDLDPSVKKRILNYDFSVHVLPSDTDDREVLQIFARMNATGVKANRQELRNAEFYGVLKNKCYNLAYEQLNRWREWKIFSETNIARMVEVEETSDLLLLMTIGLHGRDQNALDKFYKENEDSFPFEAEVAHRFRSVMDNIEATYGNRIRLSEFSKKTLFNTLFTLYYDLLFGLNSPLIKQNPKPLPANLSKALDVASELLEQKKLDDELLKILRGATSHRSSREARLVFLQGVL